MKPRTSGASGASVVSFSILERIDVGETFSVGEPEPPEPEPFSILERIDVGETPGRPSVGRAGPSFQYPRTDRRG